ncbi:MAG: Rrf2 family transcriptional regulator [Candidatus Kapabacteria bacterium]|nr:Rrf2 family transcriptional regulator [Candidatus Kapabacteria bacterium]
MIFSRASEYAIQAMLYLAKLHAVKGDGFVRIQTKEIADAHDMPYHFLAKIVQDLVKADLVHSTKGPKGGIALAHDADQISILEIVRSVGSIAYVTECVVGYEKCNAETPCPMHYEWENIRYTIFQLIREKTLSDLIGNTEFRGGRLLVSKHDSSVPPVAGEIEKAMPNRVMGKAPMRKVAAKKIVAKKLSAAKPTQSKSKAK